MSLKSAVITIFLVILLIFSDASHARRIHFRYKIPGKNIIFEEWEIQWVQSQTAAIYPKINHIIWLKNVVEIINPSQETRTIFYPGIGPYIGYDQIDLISPLLGTDYTHLVDIDKQHLSYDEFQKTVGATLGIVTGLKVISFSEIANEVYSVNFSFQGRERTATVYYGVDGNTFFPQELEQGYDVIYTRWMTTVFDPTAGVDQEQTRQKWLRFLNTETGFLIADGEYPYFDRQANWFWTHFREIDLKNQIPTGVIANARRAHLFIIQP